MGNSRVVERPGLWGKMNSNRLGGLQFRDNLGARISNNLAAACAFGAARGQFDVAAAAHELKGNRTRALFWGTATTGSALYYATMFGAHVGLKRGLESVNPPAPAPSTSPLNSAVAGGLTFVGFSVYAQLFSKKVSSGPLDPVLWFSKQEGVGPRGAATMSGPRTLAAFGTGAVLFGALDAMSLVDLRCATMCVWVAIDVVLMLVVVISSELFKCS